MKLVTHAFAGAGLAVTLLGLVLAGPATAQDVNTQRLIDTVDRLERQLRTLERQVYRGEAAPGSAAPAAAPGASSDMPEAAAARLQVRLSDLENQIRGLTGQLEQIDFQVRRASDRLDKLVADVDFRLRSLEGRPPAAPVAGEVPELAVPRGTTAPGGIVTETIVAEEEPQPPSVQTFGTVSAGAVEALRAGEAPPESATATVVAPRREAAATTPAPAPVAAPSGGPVETLSGGAQAAAITQEGLPAGTPEEQYNFARSFLMRRDFASAETALRGFLQANPEHDLAGNAQYWLGETFYVRGDFRQAARTFAEGFQRYPESAKAPDNLLKLGMSLGRLERKDDACITLAKLETDYPGAPSNVLQRADRERSQLDCP